MIENPEKFRISGIKLLLDDIHNEKEEIQQLTRQAALKAGIRARDISSLSIIKKSLDARDKGRLAFIYSVEINNHSSTDTGAEWHISADKGSSRPIIVGAGPAGLFAALILAKAGFCPLIIERGKPVDQRAEDVAQFWQNGELDENSNIQFGEGGAGAFSDGKLVSRSKDILGSEVLRLFIEFGAPAEIAYWHKPHLGSDKLPEIIAAMRQHIIQLGGEFIFSATMTDIIVNHGVICGISVKKDGICRDFGTDKLILAVGNAARDTFTMFAERGVAMESKPFAVGLRIEHSQKLINIAQYGKFAQHPLLSAADYRLTYRDEVSGRGVYTFCMCPGGHIVNASSEQGGLVINGASESARDSGFANSAVVATVNPGHDFSSDCLCGMEWQRKLEQNAYKFSGSYALPSMVLGDYLADSLSVSLPDDFSPLSCGRVAVDLHALLPEDIGQAISRAIVHWQRQLYGFADNAVLVGVETRTSSPVRIIRGENRQSINVSGLYPVGEGAGYAGGIVSSAIDGLKTAYLILENCY